LQIVADKTGPKILKNILCSILLGAAGAAIYRKLIPKIYCFGVVIAASQARCSAMSAQKGEVMDLSPSPRPFATDLLLLVLEQE
jgi:uncharacterized protein (DUF697 family)